MLRISGPDGVDERRAVFFYGMPAPGKRLKCEGREIEITGAGVFSGRGLVFASARGRNFG
jgi:hypothetical protein